MVLTMRSVFAMTTVVACTLAVTPAASQQPTADQLFQEGVRLFQRGETRTACERFAASYKLDAAPGTLYDLAACHEKDGKLWQARLEFLDLGERAANLGKQDKVQIARDRVRAIETRLPKLVLRFPASSNVASITLDGAVVAQGAWSAPLPVDDGTHTVQFAATGKASQTAQVEVHGEAQQATVPVPVLADEVPAAAAPPSTATPLPPAPEAAPAEAPHGSSKRTTGFVVGAAGIAALGAGTFFGIQALSQKSDADGACGGQGSTCPDAAHASAAQSKLDDARTSGLVSTVALGMGIAAVGIGAYLIFTGGPSSSEAPRAAIGVTPTGAFLAGRF
jgi:hypothetical protein